MDPFHPYRLEYQQKAEDYGYAGGRPLDVSWFQQPPHEAPVRAELVPEGFFAADLTSGPAVVADDQSWFTTFTDDAPIAQQVTPAGMFAGDLDSAGGQPADVSWFAIQPYEAPLRAELPPLGFSVSDLQSEGGRPEDFSWFAIQPLETPLRPEPPPQGFFAADLTSGPAVAPDDQSWFATFVDEPSVERELPPQDYFAGDLDSAGAQPADFSWFLRQPDQAPLAETILETGFSAGDYTSAVGLAPVWTDIGVVALYTASEWSATTFYFEAYIKAVVGTARARLYDVTAGAAVAGSEVTTVATSMTRVRSGGFSLIDGNEHLAQFGSLAADSGQALGARYFD